MAVIADPSEVLKHYWGYSAFRSPQEKIIQSVLQGKDVLALLPTGGGKSLCYQVPALCLEGICIVVSPLVALMKDQVEALRSRQILAEAVYSGLSYREIDRILDNCCHGAVKLLYISPERIHSELFQERLKRMNVSLIAVDEAHCISEWGYDFRPSYLEIQQLRDAIPNSPCIALTATATPKVQLDIQAKLRLKHTEVFRSSFSRPNLSFYCHKSETKEQEITKAILQTNGQGIVYARTRKACQDLSSYLTKRGIPSVFYHAGLAHADRENVATKWQKGEARVIVATNAFGMGIDKADVRFVYHLDLPESLEAYYQEAGRAGRDGKAGTCVLFYHESDFAQLRKRVEQAFPSVEYMRQVYQHLANYYRLAIGSAELESFDFDIENFKNKCSLETVPAYNALKKLEEEGLIQFNEAFYSPSRVMFAVEYEALYEFQVAHPKLDVYIKALLRVLGGGLFQHYTTFSESKLARYLQVSVKDFVYEIEHLVKLGILYYEPQNSSPKLTFLTPRQDAKSLPINKNRLEELKERRLKKVEELIHYTSAHMCRMLFTQEYFGDESGNVCGICDNCRQYGMPNDRMEQLLREKVVRGHVSMEDFAKEYSFFPKRHLYDLYRKIAHN